MQPLLTGPINTQKAKKPFSMATIRLKLAKHMFGA